MKIDPSRNPTAITVVGFGEYKGQSCVLHVIQSTKAYTVTRQDLVHGIVGNPSMKSERGLDGSIVYWRNEDGFRRWPLFNECGGYTKPSGFKVSKVTYSA